MIQYIDLVNGSDTLQTQNISTPTANVTAVNKANPCKITCSGGHPFLTGDYVRLTSIGGMMQINNAQFSITYVSPTEFTLDGIDSTAYTTYTSGGVVMPVIKKAPICLVTLPNHGLGNGQEIKITGVLNMTQLNGNVYVTDSVTTNTFLLKDTDGNYIDSSLFSVHAGGGVITLSRKMSINGITKANPAVVTAKKHGFVNGDIVIIEGVSGMTQVNDIAFLVANKTTDTFELSGINSSAYSDYVSGGTVTKPFLTMNFLETLRGALTSPRNSFFTNGDTVRFARTFSYGASITVGSGNIGFTRNSKTITTSADLRASLAVGDYVGKTSATLNGWDLVGQPDRPEIFYKISAITATTITIDTKYGGLTGTVNSVYRLRIGTEIRATGVASANAISTYGSNIIYEGGWSFNAVGTLARDSSTAFKCVSAGDFQGWNFSDLSSIWRYLSSLDSGRGFTSTSGVDCLFEYCSSKTTLYYGFFLSGGVTQTLNRASNCWAISANSGASGHMYYLQSPSNRLDNCYGIADSASNGCVQCLNKPTLNSCLFECSAVGANGGVGAKLYNIKFNLCTSPLINVSNATFMYNIEIDGATTGIITSALTTSVFIRGGSIKNCTIGISNYRCFGGEINGVSFSGNAVDIQFDEYSGDIDVVDCSTNAPLNWFISRTLYTPPIKVLRCSIDAPSVAKAIQTVAGDNYMKPQYYVQNSFGIPSGKYFAYGAYVEDTTDYRTSGYSMKLMWNSTLAGLTYPNRIASTYVTGGVAKTFHYYIKRDSGAWSGTITPILALNGKIIKTGSDITALNNDWNTEYTLSASAGEVTEDGDLTLGFIYNANNIPIWIDDVTIT